MSFISNTTRDSFISDWKKEHISEPSSSSRESEKPYTLEPIMSKLFRLKPAQAAIVEKVLNIAGNYKACNISDVLGIHYYETLSSARVHLVEESQKSAFDNTLDAIRKIFLSFLYFANEDFLYTDIITPAIPKIHVDYNNAVKRILDLKKHHSSLVPLSGNPRFVNKIQTCQQIADLFLSHTGEFLKSGNLLFLTPDALLINASTETARKETDLVPLQSKEAIKKELLQLFAYYKWLFRSENGPFQLIRQMEKSVLNDSFEQYFNVLEFVHNFAMSHRHFFFLIHLKMRLGFPLSKFFEGSEAEDLMYDLLTLHETRKSSSFQVETTQHKNSKLCKELRKDLKKHLKGMNQSLDKVYTDIIATLIEKAQNVTKYANEHWGLRSSMFGAFDLVDSLHKDLEDCSVRYQTLYKTLVLANQKLHKTKSFLVKKYAKHLSKKEAHDLHQIFVEKTRGIFENLYIIGSVLQLTYKDDVQKEIENLTAFFNCMNPREAISKPPEQTDIEKITEKLEPLTLEAPKAKSIQDNEPDESESKKQSGVREPG
jgi:hypothetical protein